MSSWFKMRLFCRILVLAFTSMPALGQATGTISGTVEDISKAAVPDATITVTQIGTNFQRIAQTNHAGQYVVPLLPAGNYEVRIDRQGFASFLQTGISLEANTQVQANALLKPGGVSTQVTVDTKPTLLQTTSTTLVQVVSSERILNLPLNGRDVLDLIGLNAGVATTNVPTQTQGADLGFGSYEPGVSIGGTRSTSVNYLLDNVDFNESQSNLPYPYPSPDSVEEFSVQMSTFDARYGRAAGGVINAVTKSGTNRFHGDVYEFLRNYDLDAANYFSGRAALRQNQFGGTLGGPVWKNRTFFFGSYQGTRKSISTPGAIHSVPSAAMKNGDFSAWLKPNGTGQIYDPLTGLPFPNNIIPADRADPVSAKILSRIPSSDNYMIRLPTATKKTSDDQFLIRVDQSVSERQRLWARYYSFHLNNTPAVSSDLLYATDGQVGTYSNLVAGYSHVFSAKWLNEMDVSYGSENPVRRNTVSAPLVNLPSLGARVNNVPGINLLDLSISGWSGISLGNAATNYAGTFQITDTASYATGRNDVHFGVDYRRYRSGFASYFQTDGQVGFTGQQLSHAGKVDAGNAYAEFYLGVANNWRQTSLSHLDRVQPFYALFLEDNLRLTDKLTVNLGLRWNPEPHPSEGHNQWTTFIPGQQSTVFPNAPLGLVAYGDQGVGAVIRSQWNLWTPRVGVAYQVTTKTVVRAAYGRFYDEGLGANFNGMIQQAPWVAAVTLIGPVQLSNPYGSGTILDPTSFVPSKNMVFPSYGSYLVPTPNLVPGLMQGWNLIVERQLSSNSIFRVGYVGSSGSHLTSAQNINPGLYLPGATASNINQRRVYNNIGALDAGTSNTDSNYNSLHLTFDKRYKQGFSILANYTYSKSIDEASSGLTSGNQTGPDPFNPQINRGPSAFDTPHRLVVSGVWRLPRIHRNALVAGILGGWHSNGVFTAQSGNPFTVESGVDTNFDGVPGDFADYTYTGWRMPANRSKQATIGQWFDTSHFTIAKTGTYGTGRRNQFRQPGAWNLDYSMFKDFPVKDLVRFQFRGELFNALNHANLGPPNATVSSPNFGRITTASSPRIIQLALKVIF